MRGTRAKWLRKRALQIVGPRGYREFHGRLLSASDVYKELKRAWARNRQPDMLNRNRRHDPYGGNPRRAPQRRISKD